MLVHHRTNTSETRTAEIVDRAPATADPTPEPPAEAPNKGDRPPTWGIVAAAAAVAATGVLVVAALSGDSSTVTPETPTILPGQAPDDSYTVAEQNRFDTFRDLTVDDSYTVAEQNRFDTFRDLTVDDSYTVAEQNRFDTFRDLTVDDSYTVAEQNRFDTFRDLTVD